MVLVWLKTEILFLLRKDDLATKENHSTFWRKPVNILRNKFCHMVLK